jgi:hypothetical protein
MSFQKVDWVFAKVHRLGTFTFWKGNIHHIPFLGNDED